MTAAGDRTRVRLRESVVTYRPVVCRTSRDMVLAIATICRAICGTAAGETIVLDSVHVL